MYLYNWSAIKIQFPVCVTINVQRWRRIALVVGKIFQLLERIHLVDRHNKGSFHIGTPNTCTLFPVTKVVITSFCCCFKESYPKDNATEQQVLFDMQLLCGGINFLMTLQGHVLFLEQFINIFCVGDYSIFFVSVSYIVFMCVVYIVCVVYGIMFMCLYLLFVFLVCVYMYVLVMYIRFS